MLDSIIQSLHKFSADLKLYVEKRTELLSIEASEKAAQIASNSIWLFALLLSILLAAFFFFSMIAALINHYTQIQGVGEFIVFVLVGLFILTWFKSRESITHNIETKIEQTIIDKKSNSQQPLLSSHTDSNQQKSDANESKI